MARIRKINVSQVEGNTNGVLPSGTIVAYEVNGEYVLRVHDGVTEGGVSLNAGQTPVIFNGTDGIVVGNLNEGIAALFNNGDVYITGGESLRFTGLDDIEGGSSAVLRFWNGEGRYSLDNDTTELVTLNVGNDADSGDPTLGFFKIITEKQVGGEKEWKFDSSGALTLPEGGDILDSNGDSVLGGAPELVTFPGGEVGETLTVTQDANNATPGFEDSATVNFIPTSILEANDWIGIGTIDPITYATITFANGDTRLITGWNTDANGDSGFLAFDTAVTLLGEDVWPFVITSYDYSLTSTPGKGISVEGNVWKFDNAGDLTLPSGSTISEGVVTDNPTIELTPAMPEVGSQKLVIKGGALVDYHLHLTTGALNETSIFLGTDEHNVRTTIEGKIQITTPGENSNVWEFGTDGSLTFPNQSGKINPGVSDGGGLQIEAEYDFEIKVTQFEDDPTIWSFAGNDITFPDGSIQSTAWTDNVDWDNVTNTPTIPADVSDLTDTQGLLVGGSANTGAITFDDNEIQANPLDTVGTQITVNSNYISVTSQNSNVFNLTKSADTDQVLVGWIIRGDGGGPQTITNKIDNGSYWSFFVAMGIQTEYPITIESPDYQVGSDPQLILTVAPDGVAATSWTFDDNGSITFPDATVQTTAYVPTDLTGYALTADIPDVSNFITAEDIPAVDLTGYALTADIPDVSNFITAEDIPAIPADVSELTDTEGLLLDPSNLTATAAAATVTSTAASVGYMGIPQNERTGDYTLVMSDAGKHLLMKSSGAITIPSNSSVPFPIGTTIDILSYGGTTTTIATTSPELLAVVGVGFPAGTRTLGGYGWAKLIKIESTAWFIHGEGLS
jgi:hypothetical protein